MTGDAGYPLVAVWMITYNHDKYIAQAIEGVVHQKTTFPFKLYIGEDCSTDNTRNICLAFKENFPELIELIFTKANSMTQNARNIYAACFNSGAKYIAMCEGDDFWTDPLKLQKQVDFLEDNNNFSLSFGNAAIEDSTSGYYKKTLYQEDLKSTGYTPIDAIGVGCPTLTMVFRNFPSLLPGWFLDAKSGDYFLRLILSTKGKFYYHNEVFGVHRKNPSGVSRTNSRLEWYLNTAKYLNEFRKVCLPEQKEAIDKKITEMYLYASFFSFVSSRKWLSMRLFLKTVTFGALYTRNGLGNLRMLFKEIIIKQNFKRFDIF